MKKVISSPQNGEFFSRYAGLISAGVAASWIGQVLSFVTQFAVLFVIAERFVSGFWPNWSFAFGVIAGTAGALLIEMTKRAFTPYLPDAVLHRRFSGLDLLFTILILLTVPVIYYMSISLSFKGSREVVEYVMPNPEQKNTAAIDSLTAVEMADISARWVQDSASVAARYAPQIAAITQAAKSKYGEESRKLKNLEAKERNTGKSYSSAKATIKENLAAINAERDVKIAELETQKGNDLSGAIAAKLDATDALKKRQTAHRLEVDSFNSEKTVESNNRVKTYGNGLGWLTVVGDLILLVIITMQRAHHKGSGRTETVLQGQYDNAPGIANEFFAAVGNRFHTVVRGWIHAFDSRTPEPVIPEQAKQVIDYSGMENTVLKLKTDGVGERRKTVKHRPGDDVLPEGEAIITPFKMKPPNGSF